MNRSSPTLLLPEPPAPREPAALRRCGRGGFSLVEILVATTVLLIIVMLVSMIFQQTNAAYQSGTVRVEAMMELRSVVGTIARDLTLAVNSDHYPGGAFMNEFRADSLQFVALTGTPDNTGKRTPQWIEYAYTGMRVNRRCWDMICTRRDDGTLHWNTAGAAQESVLNPSQGLVVRFERFPPTETSMLPLRVDIECEVVHPGRNSAISARAAGKNRRFEPSDAPVDDIVIGGREDS